MNPNSVRAATAAVLLLLLTSAAPHLRAQESGSAPDLDDRIAAIKSAFSMRSIIRDSAVIDACSLHRVLGITEPRELLGPWLGERLRGETSPGCERIHTGRHAYPGTVWWLDRITRTSGDTLVVRARVGSGAGGHTEETVLVRVGPGDWLVKEIRLTEFILI